MDIVARLSRSLRIPILEKDKLDFFITSLGNEGNTHFKLINLSLTGAAITGKDLFELDTLLEASLIFKDESFDLRGRIVRKDIDQDFDQYQYGIVFDSECSSVVHSLIENFAKSFNSKRLRALLIDLMDDEEQIVQSSHQEKGYLGPIMTILSDLESYSCDTEIIENLSYQFSKLLKATESYFYHVNNNGKLEHLKSGHTIDHQNILNFMENSKHKIIEKDKFYQIPSLSKLEMMDNCLLIGFYNFLGELEGIHLLTNVNYNSHTTHDLIWIWNLVLEKLVQKLDFFPDSSFVEYEKPKKPRKFAFIGNGEESTKVRKFITKYKEYENNDLVFISGDFGTGKTLLSKILHNEGKKNEGAFGIIDCDLLEEGKFKLVLEEKSTLYLQGTILLKNIDQLTISEQQDFIDFLNLKLDISFILTSYFELNNFLEKEGGVLIPDLKELCMKSRIHLSSLKDRNEDISPIMEFFIKNQCNTEGLLYKSCSKEVIDWMKNKEWPGNIKELKRVTSELIFLNFGKNIITSIPYQRKDAYEKQYSFYENNGQHLKIEKDHIERIEVFLLDRKEAI